MGHLAGKLMHDKFRTGGRMDGFLVIAKTGLDFTASKKGRWVNRWVGWDSEERNLDMISLWME